MPLPDLRPDGVANESPHVVILGAGASLAACPRGDRYGKPLPVMSNLVETIGLTKLLRKAGLSITATTNFEALYSEIATNPAHQELRRAMETKVTEYFEDLQLPKHVTIYDQLLLSLRSKDIVATFNWDPFLAQAYIRNRRAAWLPEIVFLHGNVAIGACYAHDRKGFHGGSCGACGEPYEQSRLLFPIAEKRYRDDPFIASEWSRLEAKLQSAFLVTIFGYSAPVSDINAREILQLAWNRNGTRELAEVEIVDIRPARQLFKSWQDFITGEHYRITSRIGQTLSFQYMRRSCDAFASAVLQNDPWAERRIPRFRRLDRLQRWCWPLVCEETEYYQRGTPMNRFEIGAT